MGALSFDSQLIALSLRFQKNENDGFRKIVGKSFSAGIS
jgi:hypothetical protein